MGQKKPDLNLRYGMPIVPGKDIILDARLNPRQEILL
jgi:hypothetical protein